ncbi:MAG: hypothetical protein V4472_10630 [Pseudomonadota bacterium]
MSQSFKKRAFSPARRAGKALRRNNEFDISAAAFPDGRIAVLLLRYPDISRAEFAAVLDFIKGARPSQLRRLRSRDVVHLKLERFLVEQQQLITSARERLVWTAAAIVMMLLLCWLLWDVRPQPLARP